jgi:hypothetical protein
LEDDIEAVEQSARVVGIIPEKLFTSVFAGLGAAIALRRPTVVYTRDIKFLPWLLQATSNKFPYTVYPFQDPSEITNQFTNYGTDVFPKR